MKKTQDDYIPITYKITPPQDIFKYEPNLQFSQNLDYPKFSLGFQHFIHQSKSKLEITKEFENKKKVYYIINKFDINIDAYPEDINGLSKKYFGLKPEDPGLNKSFFKLWEIFMEFDILDLNNQNFISAHISEDTGSFALATLFYRDKFAKNSKSDKYYLINPDIEDHHIPKLDPKLLDYYSDKRILDKSNNKPPENIKYNLITSNGGINFGNNLITQEQESFRLILSQILEALYSQEKNGNYICKLYETYTNTGSKLIPILSGFYSEIYITKPLISQSWKSEKFIICLGFKSDKTTDNKISKLEYILDQLDNSKYNLVELFPDYKFSDELKSSLIAINIEISTKQFIIINQIVEYIKKQNYRGDEYQSFREQQIKSSDYFTDLYFPKNLEKSRDIISKIILEKIQNNITKISLLLKKLGF